MNSKAYTLCEFLAREAKTQGIEVSTSIKYREGSVHTVTVFMSLFGLYNRNLTINQIELCNKINLEQVAKDNIASFVSSVFRKMTFKQIKSCMEENNKAR